MTELRQKIKAAQFNPRDMQAIVEFLEICDTHYRDIAVEISHPSNGQFDATPSNAVVSVIYRMREVLNA